MIFNNPLYSRDNDMTIIPRTISNFLEQKVNEIQENENSQGFETYYAFKSFGIILPKRTKKSDALRFIMSVYIGDELSFVNVLKLIYIESILLFPSLLCDFRFSAARRVGDIIMMGNKKIKIIDFRAEQITNVIKVGFKDKWFINEVQSRSTLNYYFVPKIKNINSISYTEQLIDGRPFARLSHAHSEPLLERIDRIVQEIAGNTVEEDVTKYVKHQIQLISDYLGILSSQDRERIFKLLDLCHRIIGETNLQVTIGGSHGDLQRGNILFSPKDGNIYVLDWETYRARTILYDKFVFFGGLRNSNSLIDALNSLKINDSMKKKILGGFSDFKVAVALFILEDLNWQLDELSVLPPGSKSIGLGNYLSDDFYQKIQGFFDYYDNE